jgi:hypothetical protein
LLDPERVAAAREARIEQADPAGAAALRAFGDIRGTYEALASAATGLLRGSLPVHAVEVPAAP